MNFFFNSLFYHLNNHSSTVFNCSVGFCSYSRSASKGSNTLVKHFQCLCRRLLILEPPQQTGRRPLSTVFDCFVGFCLN